MGQIPDIDKVSAIIREAAAETIMPRFRRLAAGEVGEKQGPHDLVTIADTECEALLSRRLADLVPGSLVVGEEAVGADPGLLQSLNGKAPIWLVDPVDGTLNFASGVPLFGVLVAFVEAGETRAGWVHDPVHDRTATAAAGEGAILDGRRMRIAVPRDLAAMHGCLNLKTGERARAARMASNADRLASVLVLRCAAQEYLAMLEGALHFAVYNRLMPWDHAAGVLLQAEAGGFAARIDGRRYRPADPHEGEPLLLAPDRETWDLIRSKILGEGAQPLAGSRHPASGDA